MSAKYLLHRLIFLAAFLAVTGGLVACSEVATGPKAWIDFPRDGARAPLGVPVSVVSHTYAPEGVVEVLLLVNGEAYRRDPPLQSGASFSEAQQEWLPPADGVYTLQVIMYDSTGQEVNSNPITVQVGETAPITPSLTPTPTVTATDTGAEIPADTSTDTPTATVELTGTPTLTPTPTPTSTDMPVLTDTPTPTATTSPTPTATPTLSPTPILPAEVNFWVDQQNITAGDCTMLHWDVERASAVYLNGDGVAGHDTRQVCPDKTTTYNLRVEAPGGNVDRAVTVNVTAPVDNTAPPIPAPMVPANGLTLDCRTSQTLAWTPVDDPSGIAGYYVKLEQEVKAGQWQSVRGWGPVSGKQVDADVQCGGIYRWAVRAQDGAGNYSNWSAWSQFSVSLD